ncbi:hypothetical protein JZ751_023957 [Albula glossodonta]|uniref:UBX domain-containing protein n=1 Tax=Albula glossodonta TaxID=121402 RepID=A0A8T2NJ13_9TELE|nr:hypothetical protein JZ751_023957 [Albula glossodonta]
MTNNDTSAEIGYEFDSVFSRTGPPTPQWRCAVKGMHVTRPKSSKGRSRPTLNHAKSADVMTFRTPPVAPRPPSAAPPDRAERSAPHAHPHTPFLRQSSVLTAEEVAKLLHSVPSPPALSLNKYRVLPSIERKGGGGGGEAFRGLEEKTSKLSLSDNLVGQAGRRGHREQLTLFRTQAASRSNPEMGSRRDAPRPNTEDNEVEDEEESLAAGSSSDQLSLLLAVRSPSGRRFQCRFLPTDTLQRVLAAAEARYGARYERAVVETMDVPRRSFGDTSMTLAQCGIQNRSVLCISTEDSSSDSA